MHAKSLSQKSYLHGKVIVITRSIEGSGPWIKYLKKHGATPYFFPTIEIVPASLTTKIKNTLKNISDFDWVVFTSAAGVRSFKELVKKSAAKESRLATQSIVLPRMPKIASVGDATARAAKVAGYRVSFQPSTANSAALGYELDPVRGRSILLLRTSIAPPDLRKILEARGAHVTELPIYKTVLRRDPDSKFIKLLKNNRVDFITFASPSAVHGFFHRVPKKMIGRARVLPAVAIGPSVATALKKAGFKNIRTAKKPTIRELVS